MALRSRTGVALPDWTPEGGGRAHTGSGSAHCGTTGMARQPSRGHSGERLEGRVAATRPPDVCRHGRRATTDRLCIRPAIAGDSLGLAASDRLREHCEPAAGPRIIKPFPDRRPGSSGCATDATGSADADRERSARISRWGSRTWHRLCRNTRNPVACFSRSPVCSYRCATFHRRTGLRLPSVDSDGGLRSASRRLG
jgi:hypothetical protein